MGFKDGEGRIVGGELANEGEYPWQVGSLILSMLRDNQVLLVPVRVHRGFRYSTSKLFTIPGYPRTASASYYAYPKYSWRSF